MMKRVDWLLLCLFILSAGLFFALGYTVGVYPDKDDAVSLQQGG
jgi:hypothetical protein